MHTQKRHWKIRSRHHVDFFSLCVWTAMSAHNLTLRRRRDYDGGPAWPSRFDLRAPQVDSSPWYFSEER
jgi:hypothetical protein